MTKRRLAQLAVFFVFLLAALWMWRSRSYPITNRGSAGETIIAFGDSLTSGVGARPGEDWPSLVSTRCSCSIINKGHPGDTTGDALARLQKDVLAHDPRLVIVAFGGNDMLQRKGTDQMFANLREIIGTIQEHGAMVALVGLNGFPFDRGIGGQYKQLARETGSIYIPNILGGILTDPKLKADQVHPNSAGYRIMADKIYDVLHDYLERGS